MVQPKLRFKSEDGKEFPEWEETPLVKALDEKKCYDTLLTGYPLLTSSRTGLMFQYEYRDSLSTSNMLTLFSVIKRNECTYRHMSDDSIFHFNINNLCDSGLVSKEYPVFISQKEYDLQFIVQHLNSSTRFLDFCRQQKKGGTRTRLYFKTLCNYRMYIPCFGEQKKISNFLSTVDEVIAQSEAELQNLEQQKKATMHKIFTQEVRFRREDGTEFPKWDEKTVNEVFKITRGYVLSTKLVKPYDEHYCYPVFSSQTKDNGLMGYFNDYLYENAITWTTDGANAGTVRFRDGKFYCTNVCGVLLNDNGYANQCIAEYLNSIAFKYVSYVGNPKLMNNIMAEIPILVPCLEEQQKIADLLAAYDEAITYAKQEFDKWKELKKGLLQQMFV